MKIIFDFLPLILFFIIYKTSGLYAAIYAITAATLLQVVATRYISGKFEKAHLITFSLLLVFGGITIAFRNPIFIMWKVSVVNIIFAIILIASKWIGKQPLLQRMLGKKLALPNKTWGQLTWLWASGFIIIAIVNAYYANIAINAREILFASTSLDNKIELSQFNCQSIALDKLCIIAQQAEQSWVNFKLFGTVGITLILIIITVVFINKYVDNDN